MDIYEELKKIQIKKLEEEAITDLSVNSDDEDELMDTVDLEVDDENDPEVNQIEDELCDDEADEEFDDENLEDED